ncbi:hypothetical protein M0812_21775 [Anaeramoeba flamelloides]|uniref:Uncharacterized protein n=1 Tax=Anaeramoeba flamelloides TaxID=1746091 RepID=A0AAV7YVM7_9EUKA|nr:hypothetical protein M0812_21775 [Anaeramoeba flamelloides]
MNDDPFLNKNKNKNKSKNKNKNKKQRKKVNNFAPQYKKLQDLWDKRLVLTDSESRKNWFVILTRRFLIRTINWRPSFHPNKPKNKTKLILEKSGTYQHLYLKEVLVVLDYFTRSVVRKMIKQQKIIQQPTFEKLICQNENTDFYTLLIISCLNNFHEKDYLIKIQNLNGMHQLMETGEKKIFNFNNLKTNDFHGVLNNNDFILPDLILKKNNEEFPLFKVFKLFEEICLKSMDSNDNKTDNGNNNNNNNDSAIDNKIINYYEIINYDFKQEQYKIDKDCTHINLRRNNKYFEYQIVSHCLKIFQDDYESLVLNKSYFKKLLENSVLQLLILEFLLNIEKKNLKKLFKQNPKLLSPLFSIYFLKSKNSFSYEIRFIVFQLLRFFSFKSMDTTTPIDNNRINSRKTNDNKGKKQKELNQKEDNEKEIQFCFELIDKYQDDKIILKQILHCLNDILIHNKKMTIKSLIKLYKIDNICKIVNSILNVYKNNKQNDYNNNYQNTMKNKNNIENGQENINKELEYYCFNFFNNYLLNNKIIEQCIESKLFQNLLFSLIFNKKFENFAQFHFFNILIKTPKAINKQWLNFFRNFNLYLLNIFNKQNNYKLITLEFRYMDHEINTVNINKELNLQNQNQIEIGKVEDDDDENQNQNNNNNIFLKDTKREKRNKITLKSSNKGNQLKIRRIKEKNRKKNRNWNRKRKRN